MRIAPDPAPTAALDRIAVQPLHLEGGTVKEAARRTVLSLQAQIETVLGTEKIPDISPGSAVEEAARLVAEKNALWVAAADWPPAKSHSAGHAPMLWLAGPAG
ncbi:hypothetical protein [Streptomyces pseudogriseolus]|uniref:hypothetical protein n=1 Tax=Streptomyces pseudogriseolus TaxID=36817 RepID=UPI003FA2915C